MAANKKEGAKRKTGLTASGADFGATGLGH